MTGDDRYFGGGVIPLIDGNIRAADAGVDDFQESLTVLEDREPNLFDLEMLPIG